jgi:hypothetical protein
MINFAQTPEAAGVAEPFPIVAPLLGLNTRDDFTVLKPTEARVLENFLPDGGSCKVRPGYAVHQQISGTTSVLSLMLYKGASANALLAGASDGHLYDVTGTPSSKASGYANNRWSHDNFNGFLFGVNGQDTPWRFNGSAISATGFTGPTLTALQTVSQVRNRLWFTVTNSADVVYGGIGAVTGALTTFQLSQIASGGKCVAIGSWSRDAGDGSDDFTVFVMSTGQIIVYQGDPATSFSLIGKYEAPAPVGLDAFVKVGGEMIILSVSGPIPVSSAVAGNAFDPVALDKWGKIAPSWSLDFKRYGTNLGWNAFFFAGLVYFVIPTGVATTRIYVMNTRNSAPTLYTKLPVAMFAALGNELYFGSYSDGFVYRHATGSDNGSQIITLARQGWSYPSQGKRSNQFTMMRANINASASCQAQFQLDTDFNEEALFAPVIDLTAESEGGAWDNATWDVDDWANDPVSRRFWCSAVARGRAVAPVVRTFSTADSVEWFSSDVLAKPGGML